MHIVSAQAWESRANNGWITLGTRDLIKHEGVMLHSVDHIDTASEGIGVWDEVSLSHREAGQLWVLIDTVCPGDVYVGSINAMRQEHASIFNVGDLIQFHQNFIHAVIVRD